MSAQMDFAEIRAQIGQLAKVDVAPHLERFRAEKPAGTPEAFLASLHERGVIPTSVFTAIHTSGHVDARPTIVSDAQATTEDALSTKATLVMAPAATRVSPQMTAAARDADARAVVDGASGEDGEEGQKYEVLGELGKGAMGEVHLARDVVLRRKVALKSILPKMQQNAGLFARFLGEMQITAQLDHPYIVPIYGVENGPSGGLAYAMKLVQGQELEHLLEKTKALLEAGKPLEGPYTLQARLETFLKVCDAIAYAHDKGVVHRDLKPANIMIGPFNEVYVMDWGISRLMGSAGSRQDQGVELYDAEGNDARQTSRTRMGSTIGTPIYMSPEQAAGKNDELDGRSDLYALALILQEVVTLEQAVGGTTLQEVLTNAKDGRRKPPVPAAPGADCPREIRAIIEKATQLKKEDRYPSVKEFAEDIRRYLRNEAVLAQPDSFTQRAARWISKHRMTALALLLLTLLLGAGATIGLLVYNRAKMAQQHNRELRLAELQASAGLRAQVLDETLQSYEKLLTRMAGAAGLALEQRRPEEARIYTSDSFKLGPSAAPGLMESKFYGKPVSFESPVAAVAAGTAAEVVSREIGSIQALGAMARGLMIESLGPGAASLSEADKLKALADTGVPILRISLTLESGVHAQFPGMSGVAADLDGRKDPLYQRAKNRADVVWGPPAGDAGNISVSCATALRSADGEVIGVLQFDVDPGRAVATALDTGGAEFVETSLLVERTGKVLAQKSSEGATAEPEMLGMNEVRDAMTRGESGYLQTARNGKQVLVTYQPLSSVDWYLVTIADVVKVERAPVKEGARPGSVAATPATATATAVATVVAKPKPPPPPAPPPSATEEPSASASESASASASASDSALVASSAPPKLTGRLPSASPTATAGAGQQPPPPPPPPPPNPFDPWKAYEKDKQP